MPTCRLFSVGIIICRESKQTSSGDLSQQPVVPARPATSSRSTGCAGAARTTIQQTFQTHGRLHAGTPPIVLTLQSSAFLWVQNVSRRTGSYGTGSSAVFQHGWSVLIWPLNVLKRELLAPNFVFLEEHFLRGLFSD